MKNYQSQRPTRNFFMMENGIDDELSPNAYYLLVKLMKLKPKEDNSNASLMKKTGFGKTRFDKAKAELVKKGYLDTKQLYDNQYAMYIGKESIRNYKALYKTSENRHVQNEIRKVKQNLEGHKNEPSKL